MAACCRVRWVWGLRMSAKQQNGAWAGAALLLVALALGGCSTSIAEIPIGAGSSDAKSKEARERYRAYQASRHERTDDGLASSNSM